LSNIVALVPGLTKETTDKSTFETTVSEYPTFWVYVPELPKNARFAELTLQNIDNKKNISRKSFVLSGQAGIISFNLPTKPEYSLKTGTKYQDYLYLSGMSAFCASLPYLSTAQPQGSDSGVNKP
jgi:Domain of Unknown Function (DUF928)